MDSNEEIPAAEIQGACETQEAKGLIRGEPIRWPDGFIPPRLAIEFENGEYVSAQPDMPPQEIIYKNWKGEVSVRKIFPRAFWYGGSKWHPEPQWLVEAYDFDKAAIRLFALKDMIPIPSWASGQCDCSCADKCPLGRRGSEMRCTANELRDALMREKNVQGSH